MKYRKFWPLGLVLLAGLSLASGGRLLRLAQSMEIFAAAYRAVNRYYVEEPEPTALMRIAIDSMNGSLDPYTNYFSEAQIEQFRINFKGSWDGVGMELIEYNGQVLVNELVDGSAAKAAGIQVGDELLRIDGSDISGKKLEDIERSLHGKAGTQVLVETRRGVAASEEHNLTRTKVERKNVPYYSMLDDSTAYIILTTFTERAGGNVSNALQELQEKHNPKQVILDLRNNGGGLLIEAVNLCNVFLPRNKLIVYTKNKVANWDRSFSTRSQPLDSQIPLIVLVNGQSASASEIVAGAIQDYDRGVLLGQRSFGKGLVQNTYDIGYNSKVKLTTARYHIPSGRCIQALAYKGGKSKRMEDSLRSSFSTENGREVFDGGGLEPDHKIALAETKYLLDAITESRLLFEFANDFRQQVDSIAPALEFQVSEQLYADYLQFLAQKNYAFELPSEKELAKLEKTAKEEKKYASEKAAFEALRLKIQAEKKRLLNQEKEALSIQLRQAILRRYYSEDQVIMARLKEDKEVKAAIALFGDAKAFGQLLEAPKK
ncbi:C-terminal processing peptidase [Saprospira grandis DSM 2844]|uniref:C-terminal processing peptidase n=1 Tax=Saprospira grandis DSM 2844 TaxID=694433 RepID=J0NWJ7_9BACT|nr:S41 family peptidase [Saprospira grandis]EJF51879.1 C-terminal processing peptidase [Saprospira grandis DSM 2844]